MYPRDGAGSFKLPSTKEGQITAMCALPDRMEIYTPHETFMVQTPNATDPGRTNPRAMWVNARTHGVGSASPAVARTFIMADEILKLGPFPAAKRDALLLCMHGVKETLLQCVAAADAIEEAVRTEIAAVEESGFRLADGGRALARFPVVPDLDARASAFLIAARRAITEICQVARHCFGFERPHSNVDYLLKAELVPRLGEDNPLVKMLHGYQPGAKRVIDLRNGLEHGATTVQRTIIRNFTQAPTNQLQPPVWYLDGEEPQDLASAVHAVPSFLVDLAEGMFVGCVDQNLPERPPFQIEMIEKVNPECPVRYRLTLDLTRFTLAPDPVKVG